MSAIPPRPVAKAPQLDNVPPDLVDIPRWICWRHYFNRSRRRWTKLPVDAKTGQPAKVDDPATWSDFGTAAFMYEFEGGADGIGFVFNGDGLIGGDFDECLDPGTGELSPEVTEAMARIGGYWEVSPSGTGLHFIARATLGKAYKDDSKGIELYQTGRYFTVTGLQFNGQTNISSEPIDLQWFVDKHFPAKVASRRPGREVAPEGANFFRNVNDAAMANLGSWVPDLFPEVADYQDGYRVTSVSLGRDLEEDISIVSKGIVDFGVSDMGDARDGKRTPIDLVIEWRPKMEGTPEIVLTPKDAALWLCDRLQIQPAALGWQLSKQGYRPRTEFGNAERMLDRYGDGLMYVPELETWFKWTGVYWRRAQGVELDHLAKETIRALPDEVGELTSDDERIEFFKFCAACQRAAMVGNMVRLATSDPRVMVPLAQLDRDNLMLGVGNGAVDLRTGELLPPTKDHHITTVTAVEYDKHGHASLFEQTLADVFNGDKEMAAFFQRLIGYALLGQPNEDIMVIPHGSGSNGKSTVFGVIRDALGMHAKMASADTFLSDGKNAGAAGAAREDVLRLRGARFVYISEPDEGSELREGLIKSMTGGEPIPARGLYAKTTIEVTPTWVSFMPTNHKPIVKGDDHAIWRRLMLVPFTRNFDEDPTVVKDPHRAEKLAKEMPGILAWAVRGAMAYLKQGLRPPASVKQAREEYRNEMDLLAEWIDECCAVGPREQELSKTLWSSWEHFARTRGELRMVPNQRSLGRRLASKGFTPVKDRPGMRGRGFAGLSLKEFTDFSVGESANDANKQTTA